MRLIFVYNADSGTINAILDSLHKVASPNSYDCNLCALTFGSFTENKTWKNFREHSEIAMEFLHKDEFLDQFGSKWLPEYTFPIILVAQNGELEVFLNSNELNKLETAEALIREITKRQLDY